LKKISFSEEDIMFTGSAVALVTPFKEHAVDFPALEKLIDFHVTAETECIVVCGTTGESSTQSHEEHKRVIRFATDYLKARRGSNKFPLLMAGTGSNNTAEAMDLTIFAKEAGADCALQITPYYNKPTQKGLLEHFRTLAREVDIPQVVYNIQSRCGVNVSTEVMVELAQEPNIIGVKEASGNIGQMSDVIRLCPEDFYVWSGDDGMTLPLLALGGKGVISVVANIAPRETSKMVHDFLEGRVEDARAIHHKMTPLVKSLFIETNPIPVKTAVNILSANPEYGLPHCGGFRLPMTDMSPQNREIIERELRAFGFSF